MTPSGFFLDHLWLIPLFPLVAAVLVFAVGRQLPRSAISLLAVGGSALSFSVAAGAVFQLLAAPPSHRFYQQIIFEWVAPGAIPFTGGLINYSADWGYLLDPLSSVMLLLASGVGLLAHVYSLGSMRREAGYHRYFASLSLLMFSTLLLLLANNLLLLFAGWQGVTLSSYLLISFHFQNEPPASAGKKVFLFNLLGDAGFLLGLFLVATTFGTVRFTSNGLGGETALPGISQVLATMVDHHALTPGSPVLAAIALLFFVGAIGKGAQIPLHIWLSDAAEAPIPASALIHTVSMVTAGVYLVVRLHLIYQLAPVAMAIIAVIGVITAVIGACLAMVDTDIRKVLAYSTISQVGYMFLALGAGAFSTGIFQLMSHAFFKSLLFLGAGSLVYSLSGEHDLRKMGGMSHAIPSTSRPFLIAILAIAALPPFAGFFSAQEVLGQTFYRSQFVTSYLLLWSVGVLTAGLTAFYSFRLLFLAFYGRSRVSPELEVRIQQPTPAMTAPMMILAFLCIIGGWFALPVLWGERNTFDMFLAPSLGVAGREMPVFKLDGAELLKAYALMAAPLIAAMLGILLANRIYLVRPKLREKIPAAWPRLYGLLVRSFYVNELYDALFVSRVKDLSNSLEFFDDKIIGGIAINGAGRLAAFVSRFSSWWDKWVIDGVLRLAAGLMQRLSHPVRLFQSGSSPRMRCGCSSAWRFC